MNLNDNYRQSNRITSVKVEVGDLAIKLTNDLLACVETNQRQNLGEQLLDELCDSAKIDIVKLKISDTRQYHKRRGRRIVFKQYGYYRDKYIYIQNRTPARGQLVAPKTFLDTLLHEWLHHYDTYALGLNSIHTKGFYERLKDLRNRLRVT
ncbi:MAG: hypothetical protein RB292_00750 [Patescibacteria group bacterium]|jgi:hypothetical protein|nr:hypothetical protein [Patescibacteria group bacterium]